MICYVNDSNKTSDIGISAAVVDHNMDPLASLSVPMNPVLPE
jgi:hypothetical protein